MNAFTEARLVPVLEALAATFGHAWKPQQLEGYVQALGDLPVERVLDACQAVARAEKFFPKPAVIRERAVISRVPVAAPTRPLAQPDGFVNPETGVYESVYRCGQCEDTGWLPIAAREDTGDNDPRPHAGGYVLRWSAVRNGARHACVRRCDCRRRTA